LDDFNPAHSHSVLNRSIRSILAFTIDLIC
jgi:hypothetical protein